MQRDLDYSKMAKKGGDDKVYISTLKKSDWNKYNKNCKPTQPYSSLVTHWL